MRLRAGRLRRRWFAAEFPTIRAYGRFRIDEILRSLKNRPPGGPWRRLGDLRKNEPTADIDQSIPRALFLRNEPTAGINPAPRRPTLCKRDPFLTKRSIFPVLGARKEPTIPRIAQTGKTKGVGNE
jgi:hypothetical protein